MKRYIFTACLYLFSIMPPLHAAGQEMRIISLGPYITENIYLLGLGDNIAGLTIHDSPEKRAGKEIIGTLLEPGIEKILTINPDIVIGSREGNRPESLRTLQQLGIKTLVLNELHTFQDICDNFILLGRGLNAEEKARKIADEQKQRLKNIVQTAETRKTQKRVFFILGFRPLFTNGSKTYINEMIEYAGGRNIFGQVNKKWFSPSLEEVIRRDPEHIVFLRMEEELPLLWERLRDVTAVRQEKFHGIEPTIIGSPTPKSFVDSVETLYGIFHFDGNNEN